MKTNQKPFHATSPDFFFIFNKHVVFIYLSPFQSSHMISISFDIVYSIYILEIPAVNLIPCFKISHQLKKYIFTHTLIPPWLNLKLFNE